MWSVHYNISEVQTFRLSFSPEMTICPYQNQMIYFPELKEFRAMLSMVALSSSLLFMHLARCDYRDRLVNNAILGRNLSRVLCSTQHKQIKHVLIRIHCKDLRSLGENAVLP